MFGATRGRGNTEPTIDDVAAAAGVSIRTVSRVLNNSVNVNKETRARVQEAVEKLHFRPSLRARGLATGRSYLIGLLHDEYNALVLGEVLLGAVQEASEHGYEVLMHPTPVDPEQAINNVVDFVHRSRVDGLLIMAPVSGVVGLPQALAETGVAALAMSAAPLEGFDEVVTYDERGGAAQAAQHLIELGHRRIAVVSGPNLISARERRGGFVSALESAGIPLMAEIAGDYGFESGVAAGMKLLSQNPRPTAIFAISDMMAAGVLKAASQLGVSVPQELSVVGFDRSMIAPILTPGLTAVYRPMRNIAKVAAERLICLIEGREAPARDAGKLEMAPDASSGPAPD